MVCEVTVEAAGQRELVRSHVRCVMQPIVAPPLHTSSRIAFQEATAGLTVVENKFCAAEGDSGDAASVGLAKGLPAFASSKRDKTCRGVWPGWCAAVQITYGLFGKMYAPSFETLTLTAIA